MSLELEIDDSIAAVVAFTFYNFFSFSPEPHPNLCEVHAVGGTLLAVMLKK